MLISSIVWSYLMLWPTLWCTWNHTKFTIFAYALFSTQNAFLYTNPLPWPALLVTNESAAEWVPNPGDPVRRAHGPYVLEKPGGYEGPRTLKPLLTQGGRQEPSSIRPPNKSHPSTWIPLPLPCCTAAWGMRPFWNGLWRPGAPPNSNGGLRL